MDVLKAKIYCGLTVEDKCKSQLHPLNEVKNAKKLIDSKNNIVTYSNSTDFIAMIKYYGEQEGYSCEFFLDGVSFGNDIEPIFDNLNKSLSFMDNVVL